MLGGSAVDYVTLFEFAVSKHMGRATGWTRISNNLHVILMDDSPVSATKKGFPPHQGSLYKLSCSPPEFLGDVRIDCKRYG